MATFSRSADCAETPTLLSPWPCTSLSQRPSPRHRHRHSPEAILLEPGGVCGRLPARVRTTGKLGSQGRGGGLNPDPGQVAPRIPGSGTEMEEVRQSFKIARRRETDLGGPRRTSAAELASKTPGSPDFQLSAQEASRPRAPQRAGPGTRLCFSQHSLGVQDRTIVAGLWWSHATGATPPKPSQRLRASQPPQAPLCPRPRPLRAGPAPAVFLFPSPRGQPPLRS